MLAFISQVMGYKSRQVMLPLYKILVRLQLEHCSPDYRKTNDSTGDGAEKNSPGYWLDWSILVVRRDWVRWVGAEKDLTRAGKNCEWHRESNRYQKIESIDSR